MANFDDIERILKSHNQALKTELQTWQTPSAVEQNLLAVFAQHFPKRPRYQRWQVFSWELGAGLCACGLVLVLLLKQTSPWQLIAGQEPVAGDNPIESVYDVHEDIPFMALYSDEEILKQEDMRIVQAQIPTSVLATMGVTVNPEIANQSAKAEVLVGANDEFLAVRFLPN